MRKKIIFLAALNSSLIIIILGLLIYIQTKEARNSVNDVSTETAVPSVSADYENDDNSVYDSNISEETADTKDGKEDTVNVDDGDSNGPIDLVFAGDFYLSDYVLDQYNKSGIHGVLSDELLKQFTEADLTMVNEEFSFSEHGIPMEDKQYTFRVSPKYISLFKEAGIDVVTLANNHVLDYGEQALLDSMNTLKNASISYVGAGANRKEASEYKSYTIHNKRIGIIAASRVIPVAEWNATDEKPGLFTTYDPTNILSTIKQAKEVNDYVIVYVHWGIERHDTPEAYQRTLAKQYIDAGADLVIGSHPHVLQGIEYYNGKPIVYSLGNFMFYNTIKQTALLTVKIDLKDKLTISLIPCKAENAKTMEIENAEYQNFYDYITGISYGISIDEYGLVSENNE